jgi:hypothetical protein
LLLLPLRRGAESWQSIPRLRRVEPLAVLVLVLVLVLERVQSHQAHA